MKSHYLLLLMVFISVSVFAQESGKEAVVALPNMNVVYSGIPNPVQIAIPGVTSDRVSATITNGSIIKTNNGWEIKPSIGNGTMVLTVLVNNQKVSEKTFRVKPIPVPVAVLAGKNNGGVSKNEILKAEEIQTELKDFLWDLKFEVKSYSVLYSVNGSDKEISVNGNKLTDEVKSIISNLAPGKNIVFKDIIVIAPDKTIHNISPLVLSIN